MKQLYLIRDNLVFVDLINEPKGRIEMEINSVHCKMLIYDNPIKARSIYKFLQTGQVRYYCRNPKHFIEGKRFKMFTICMN